MDTHSASTKLATLADLPPGAPTLARHLHAMLGIIDGLDLILSPDDQVQTDAARSWLAALPNVAVPTETVGDRVMWREEDGRLTPEHLVKPAKMLEDLFVRTVANGALAISGSLTRFKALSFAEAQALIDTLGRDYGVEMGGKAGNVSFYSFDRAFKVQITAQEQVVVGPTIEIAKTALAQWLGEVEAADEVKALVNSAFGLDDQGRVRVAELVRLKRLPIAHPKWQAAMAAIDEAMEVAGKAVYLRVYRRRADGRYDLIPLDLASA